MPAAQDILSALNLLNTGAPILANWSGVDTTKPINNFAYITSGEPNAQHTTPSVYGPNGVFHPTASPLAPSGPNNGKYLRKSDTTLAFVGSPVFFFNSFTGSLCSVKSITDEVKSFDSDPTPYNYVNSAGLVMPQKNTLGLPPEPIAGQLIPPDSHRLFCDLSVITFSNSDQAVVVHDQYWAKSASSYMIAPMSQKRLVIEHVSGVTTASSRTDEIAAALEISASASWATISASISASLSVSQTVNNSLSVYEAITSVSEDIVQNGSQEPGTVVIWQLTDVISIIRLGANAGTVPPVKIEVAQSPAIIRVYPADLTFTAPVPLR